MKISQPENMQGLGRRSQKDQVRESSRTEICKASAYKKKRENMQSLRRRSRNLSSNFGSRAPNIVSRLQTLTGGEAKTWQNFLTNSLEFKAAIVKVMVYSWIKIQKTNHFSPSVRFSLLSSKFIIAHVPLPLMCEAAGVFHPQQDLKQMLSDDICWGLPLEYYVCILY